MVPTQFRNTKRHHCCLKNLKKKTTTTTTNNNNTKDLGFIRIALLFASINGKIVNLEYPVDGDV